MSVKRVFRSAGNGFAYPIEEKCNTATGARSFEALKGPPQMKSEAALRANGFLVLPAVEMTAKVAPEIMQTESSNGSLGVSRNETPGVKSGLPSRVWKISLDNTTEADHTALIGDPAGLVQRVLNIANLDAGVTVGGTFGTQTLSQIKDIVKTFPVDLHGLHTSVDNQSFYTNGEISYAKAQIDGTTVDKTPIDFSQLTSDMTNSPEIRRDTGFRGGLFGNSAMIILVPAGRTINMTFGLSAEGVAANMVKIK